MAYKKNVLVVANVTAASDNFVESLRSRAQSEPADYTLVVPATPFGGGRKAAQEKLKEALGKLKEAGVHVEGSVGHPDPIVAVTEAWDPRRYDEIVVSTLPMRFSKWLHAGLPERIERLTGAPVKHIVSEPKHQAEPTPVSRDEDRGSSLGPLSVLGWGGPKEE